MLGTLWRIFSRYLPDVKVPDELVSSMESLYTVLLRIFSSSSNLYQASTSSRIYIRNFFKAFDSKFSIVNSFHLGPLYFHRCIPRATYPRRRRASIHERTQPARTMKSSTLGLVFLAVGHRSALTYAGLRTLFHRSADTPRGWPPFSSSAFASFSSSSGSSLLRVLPLCPSSSPIYSFLAAY